MHRGFLINGKLCYIDISIKEAADGYQFISTGEYSSYDEAIAFLEEQRDAWNRGRKQGKITICNKAVVNIKSWKLSTVPWCLRWWYWWRMKKIYRSKMNFEDACREFLKGCSGTPPDRPQDCPHCLDAFVKKIKKLVK